MKTYNRLIKKFSTLIILCFGVIGTLGVREFALSKTLGFYDEGSLVAQDSDQATVSADEDDGPWVVRAYYEDRQMLMALVSWREPWEVNREQGYLVVDIADQSEMKRLLNAGFRVQIDPALTTRFRKPNVHLPGQTSGIPGYPCYRTVEETFATAEAIVAEHPDLATWIDIGDSWEKMTPGGNAGYDLMVLRLTNSAIPGPKPKAFIMSSIHAREYTPAELNTRFAEYLIENYDTDPDITWLLDYQEVYLLLHANPDGRKKAETGLSWRKNTNENYCSPTSNNRGADLNRNFEFQWGCCGGSSGFECDDTYRGPEPASEPETQAIQTYLRTLYPDLRDDSLSSAAPMTTTGVFLDIHSYSQLVLWSWGFTTNVSPNGLEMQTLGRKLAYFNGYAPSQAVDLYTTDGATDDFVYGDLGIAAYTFELGTTFFQSCSDFEDKILPDNLASLLYLVKVTQAPYMLPAGPDVVAISVSSVAINQGQRLEVQATVDDTRYNNANGSEPVQNIVGAELYVDTLPRNAISDTVVVSMTVTDGLFDQPVEAVKATLDTTGLDAGQHIMFVRGQDADGNWGPPSAHFFYLVDPEVAPVLNGYVRDLGTNAPVSAVISAGPFHTNSYPETGYYRMPVISNTYTVTAAAPGYLVSSTTNVELPQYQNARQDFYLFPICDIFADDMESGNLGWTAEGSWTNSMEASHSPTYAWTDSPGSNYGNQWNDALTSPTVDLSGVSNVSLSFWHTYDLEQSYDFGIVEYSINNGATWVRAANYTGEDQTDWVVEELPLPALDNQAQARFRFRLTSDTYITADGWHIDDIKLSGTGSTCLPSPFEPTAQFTTSGSLFPDTAVKFSNLTLGTPPLEYKWSFGNSLGSSNESDPTVVYTATGAFTVTLVATNSIGSDAATQVIVIRPSTWRSIFLPLIIRDAQILD